MVVWLSVLPYFSFRYIIPIVNICSTFKNVTLLKLLIDINATFFVAAKLNLRKYREEFSGVDDIACYWTVLLVEWASGLKVGTF